VGALTTQAVSADEMVHRVKVGLAEMGYPDVGEIEDAGGWTFPNLVCPEALLTDRGMAAWWTAYRLAAHGVHPVPCWSCWLAWMTAFRPMAWACVAGDCPRPEGPATPPRELLRPA